MKRLWDVVIGLVGVGLMIPSIRVMYLESVTGVPIYGNMLISPTSLLLFVGLFLILLAFVGIEELSKKFVEPTQDEGGKNG